MRQNYNFAWVFDLGHLLFPTVCRACGFPIKKETEVLCISCRFKLPRTFWYKMHDNPVYRKFWGQIPVHEAFTYLHFRKGNVVQTLLHSLKYHGNQDIGESLGRMFGRELVSGGWSGPEVIIPLPLHADKLRARGFNQCDSVARGLSESLGIPHDTASVKRVIANPTQTKKSRFDRWLNVEKIFEARAPERIRGKHILLIDDVITTGSTLESCGRCVLDAGAERLSIATVAGA